MTMVSEVRWEDPAHAEHGWMRAWGPMTALYQDISRRYAEHQSRCWDECASPMAKDHIFTVVDGWVYRRGPDFDQASAARLAQHQESVGGFGGFNDWYMTDIRPRTIATIERLRKHPLPTRPYSELVAHLDECIDGFGHVMGNLHWRMAAGVMGKDGERPTFSWPDTYHEITGRPAAEGPILLGGLVNELTKTIKKIRQLARVRNEDGEDSKRFQSGFSSLLRRYGHRTGAGWGSAAGFAAPTWNVTPDIPLQMIRMYAKSDIDELERKEREVTRERKRLERAIRKELASDPERLKRFETELAIACGQAFFLEDHNDWMDQSAPGVARDAAHVVGLRLAKDDVIDDPRDVIHLFIDEIESPPRDARALVAERKETFKGQQDEPPEFIGAGDPPPAFDMNDAGEGHIGNELRGVRASSGRFTGRAKVCKPSPIPPDVDEGDILVAVDAGPDWTPVFAILGAVVLDKGAAWQHAAVVAREFGVPAVTGVKVGTEVIKDGDTITVDGDAGVVYLS